MKKPGRNIYAAIYSFLVLSAITICSVHGCAGKTNNAGTPRYNSARLEMVEKQIVDRGIEDTLVINALRKVERHMFVPESQKPYAYEDRPLPIGEDQTISQPYVVALMTEKLAATNEDVVLEIGTGSGYQAAILSLIAKEVYTIEIVPALAKSATERLENLGYKNVQVKCGDGFEGWPDAAPFNGIIVTCAAPRVPEPLVEQLAEGGRLVMPEGEAWQMLVCYRKVKGELEKTEIAPVMFVPMTGEIRK